MRPEIGIPNADSSSVVRDLPHVSSQDLPIAQNPYLCFGAPGVAWPRGFPLAEIQSDGTSGCTMSLGSQGSQDIDSDGQVDDWRRVGVVQALDNGDPDMDAIF